MYTDTVLLQHSGAPGPDSSAVGTSAAVTCERLRVLARLMGVDSNFILHSMEKCRDILLNFCSTRYTHLKYLLIAV
jgi:hypothetical protein